MAGRPRKSSGKSSAGGLDDDPRAAAWPLEWRAPGDLLPYAQNPRENEAAIAAVAASIRTFGFRQPIVVDAEGVIVVGHTRWLAAQELGLAQVPVHIAADLTPDQARAYRIADNKTNELATWDLDRLAGELRALPDVDWASLGFGEKDLAQLLAPPVVEGLTDPDAVPEVRQTDIHPGDLFELGAHRLLCGDCRNAETVATLAAGDKVQLVVADPPYCSGGFQEAGRAAGTWGDIASDTLSTRGFIALLTKALEAARAQTVYLFTDWRMWIPLYDLVESSGLAVRSMIVWDKGTPGLGALWRTQHELVMFASREKNARIKGLPAIGNVIQAGRTGNAHHYTEKPVELIAKLLTNDQSSERRACPVFDLFAGSGTTLIAAEQVQRPARLLEVEPRFVQVAIDRWEAFTGQKARKVTADERHTEKRPAAHADGAQAAARRARPARSRA